MATVQTRRPRDLKKASAARGIGRERTIIDAAWIRERVEDFVSRSPENTLGFAHQEKVRRREVRPCSNWSERHAAYVAGLGTFGPCDGLTTTVGKAHRTGSEIARELCLPSERPYRDHHAYCLHFTHGICGKCIARCPVKTLDL